MLKSGATLVVLSSEAMSFFFVETFIIFVMYVNNGVSDTVFEDLNECMIMDAPLYLTLALRVTGLVASLTCPCGLTLA